MLCYIQTYPSVIPTKYFKWILHQGNGSKDATWLMQREKTIHNLAVI